MIKFVSNAISGTLLLLLIGCNSLNGEKSNQIGIEDFPTVEMNSVIRLTEFPPPDYKKGDPYRFFYITNYSDSIIQYSLNSGIEIYDLLTGKKVESLGQYFPEQMSLAPRKHQVFSVTPKLNFPDQNPIQIRIILIGSIASLDDQVGAYIDIYFYPPK